MMSNKKLNRRLFLIEKSYIRNLTKEEKRELKKLEKMYKIEIFNLDNSQ